MLKAFTASIEMIIWFLSFNLFMWCITLIDLHILKNPCIPGIKPTWSCCMILLMCWWILFAGVLLRIFAEFSSWMDVEFCENAFTTSIEIILSFVFFTVNWWIVFIYFWMLNQPWIPDINSNWSRCIILFYIWLD